MLIEDFPDTDRAIQHVLLSAAATYRPFGTSLQRTSDATPVEPGRANGLKRRTKEWQFKFKFKAGLSFKVESVFSGRAKGILFEGAIIDYFSVEN